MKLWDLSKAAGISLPTISDFLKNDTKNLRMDTMLHICEGFNITLKDFFDDLLFNEVIAEQEISSSENHTLIDSEKQVKKEYRENELDLER